MPRANRPFYQPPNLPYNSGLPLLPPPSVPAAAPAPAPGRPYHNWSDGQLADELGALKADIADLKSREDLLRAELIGRHLTVAEGSLFRATVTAETLRETLDAEAIRKDMGPSWVAAHSKVSIVAATVRVSARTGASKRAA